jgi:hypothetical protein
MEAKTFGNVAASVPVPTERCYKLEPPRRWRGLWQNGFDASLFCPEPARECPSPTSRTWLEISQGANWKPGPAGLFEIEFIGRHTAYHSDGHRFDGVSVDRMLSAKLLKSADDQSNGAGTLK